MKMLCFAFLLLFNNLNSFAESSNYGFYAGINGGQANDTGKGIEEMKGSAYGVNLGYRWIHWALELGYSKYDLKAERGQSDDFFIDKGEMDASSIDILVRGFLFKYITLAFGYNIVSSEEDIQLTNVEGDSSSTFESKGGTSYDGTFFQAGIVLPLLRNFDIWLLYQNRNWSADSLSVDDGSVGIESIDYNIQQISAAFVFYFD